MDLKSFSWRLWIRNSDPNNTDHLRRRRWGYDYDDDVCCGGWKGRRNGWYKHHTFEKPNCFIALSALEEPSPTQMVFASQFKNSLPTNSVTTFTVKLPSFSQFIEPQIQFSKKYDLGFEVTLFSKFAKQFKFEANSPNLSLIKREEAQSLTW